MHVGEWDPDVVSGAIRRELARGGQVYYVSNRVRSMEEAVRRVTAAAGEARVGVAHGQMSKEQLERVMEDFSAGELDVGDKGIKGFRGGDPYTLRRKGRNPIQYPRGKCGRSDQPDAVH